jgi:peptidoglycan/LPS O-acetylase OafA/YrhL
MWRWLDHSVLLWLGDRSYSFYAVNQVFVVLAGYVILAAGWPDRGSSVDILLMAACAVAAALASAAVAALTYPTVEIPWINASRGWARMLSARGRPSNELPS